MSDENICGAKTKSGKPCRAMPMRNGKCRLHGGKTPGGLASPHFKTGRYSKYIPAQLASKYQEALADPDVLSLNEDVALLRSFVLKHLSDIATGDTHPAWIDAKKAFDEMEAAGAMGAAGYDKYIAAKLRLQLIIEPNYRAAISEGQVVRYVDQLGKLADKERRLLIDRQQVITVEQMMILLTAIVSSIKQRINDRLILNAIQNDIQGLISTGS
jgi:hypothetical protein